MKQVINHTVEGVHPGLHKLGSEIATERLQAEAAIEALGTRAVDELLRLLAAEANLRTKRLRARSLWALAACSLIVVMAVAKLTEGRFDPSIISACLWVPSFIAVAAAVSSKASSAAIALIRYEDPRAIGPLVELLTSSVTPFNAEVRRGLMQLLPAAPASIRTILSTRQVNCINNLLKGSDRELSMAVIKGLETFGTARSLPAVRRLADSYKQQVMSDTEWRAYSELRQAARALLPILEQRANEQGDSEILLRPASSPDSPEQVLLRPVGAPTNADETQLLRPAQPD